MRKSGIRLVVGLLCLGLLSVGGGCGDGGPAKSKLYSVKGKITGPKPLTDCTISFIAVGGDGKGSGGKIGADGSYTLTSADGREGAEPGKYKVVLQASPDAAMKAMMSGGGGPAGGPPVVEAPFPDEYRDANTSPKEVEVKAESNTIDIAI